VSPVTGNFLILHGWQNRRPSDHWQYWLNTALTARGHAVKYPQLSEPEQPCLADWISEIEGHLDAMPTGNRAVICHSLSCVAWLHLAASAATRRLVDRVVFVAPPDGDFLRRTAELESFASLPRRDCVASTSAVAPRLVCSNNDPYCAPTEYAEYAPSFEIDEIAGEGHFDVAAGYGEWQSILDWCEGRRNTIYARGSRKVI
jgi:uncharacterized protein